MIARRRGLALLVMVTACATLPKQPARPLWGDLQPGRYAVGFRSGVWYPATTGGDRLRYRHYVDALDKLEAFLQEHHVSDRAMVDLFDAPMYARADAPALKGTFPSVFVVLRSGQSAADLAVVAEFLASHGYVVRAVDSTVSPDASAEWLHDVRVSALTLASAQADPRAKAELQSLAQTLLRYLESHRTR